VATTAVNDCLEPPLLKPRPSAPPPRCSSDGTRRAVSAATGSRAICVPAPLVRDTRRRRAGPQAAAAREPVADAAHVAGEVLSAVGDLADRAGDFSGGDAPHLDGAGHEPSSGSAPSVIVTQALVCANVWWHTYVIRSVTPAVALDREAPGVVSRDELISKRTTASPAHVGAVGAVADAGARRQRARHLPGDHRRRPAAVVPRPADRSLHVGSDRLRLGGAHPYSGGRLPVLTTGLKGHGD
jgi:hypothetical protein